MMTISNGIRNQKYFKKPIGNGNVADSSMIALTDEPLLCWKPKKNGSLNINLEWKNSSTAASPKI